MQRISAHLDPFLKEGRTYYRDFYKSEHGSSGGGVYFMDNGVEYNSSFARNNPEDENVSEMDALEKEFREMRRKSLDLSDLYSGIPADTKIRFAFSKGRPMERLVMQVQHLLADLKYEIRQGTMRYNPDNETFVKGEAIIKFVQQADELGVYTDATTMTSGKARTLGFPADTNLVKCLHKATGGTMEKLYYKLEGDNFIVQSQPGFPEFGIPELDPANESIELDSEYKKRKDAQAEAIRMRTEFYKTLGTVLPVPIYLSVGGFRSNSWPEGSHYHTSEVLRVIYTTDSTIVITDGLSDVYSSERSDANLEYNGIGAEMYIEFDGHIAYEDIYDHFCVALLNSVTQIAIEHSEFKALIDKNEHLTIEFKEENVELWCVKGMMGASNGISTFFRPGQYAGDDFGAFINMPSKNVPAKLQLNLEEILLVNVKPFSNVWLTPNKLREDDEDIIKQVRLEMMAKFEESGEGNKIPLTYVVEGADDTLARLFPMSDVEPRDSEIDMELIYSMASGRELTAEEDDEMTDAHHEFIASGGENGRFEQMHVGGMPLNVYVTGTKEGKQYKVGRKTIPPHIPYSEADLPVAEFTGCIARGVDFSYADLSGSLFTNAFLEGANFEEADLRGVDFTGSNLTGANFRNAKLDGADFEIVNLTGADFTGANTTDATFKGANMTDVTY